MTEHLARHQVDLGKTPLTLGAALAFDSVAERFTGVGAPAANTHLTRAYRAPFVVPSLV
jgi:hypothetical protein